MKLALAEQMRQIEEEAMRRQKVSLAELMARAGQAVAEEARQMLPVRGRVAVFCGQGNNGGDGYVAAYHLAENGYDVTVVNLAPAGELTTAAREARGRLRDTAAAEVDFSPGLDLGRLNLTIDAVFGFGLKGTVKGPAAQVIKYINTLGAKVLAVDVPSGIDSDTGQVSGLAVRADRTVTFTCPKVGLVIYPGSDYAGDLRVADIGISPNIVKQHVTVTLVTAKMAKQLLPRRRHDAHKGNCGRILVVAGSVGMTGAAAMCATAALKIGAGLVTLGLPESLNDIMEVKLTEIMTRPLPETPERTLRAKAFDVITEMTAGYDVLAVGPGLSTHESTVTLIRQLVGSVDLPMVIDADGLNALVGKTELIAKRPAATVLTPHPGELGRLLDSSAEAVQSDRLSAASRASLDWNATVVLKGANSLIASGEAVTVNSTGNPGMATAGTGDVLTGMIAGLVGQGLAMYPAAVLATYLHGLAGDLAAADRGQLALVATDLIDYLPKALVTLKT